jgi:hypothetical protein
MEESFKDIIILILAFVLLYLIYKKINKSKYSYPTKPKYKRHLNNPVHCPVHNQVHNPAHNLVHNLAHNLVHNPAHNPVHNPANNQVYYQVHDPIIHETSNNEELIPINSNGVTNNSILSNMSEHELIHIHDSKPFIIDDEVPLTNIPEMNAVELEPQKFNYFKNFDEENFTYFDPIGLYNVV